MNQIAPRRISAQHIVMIAVPILAAAITVHAGEKTGSTMITAEMRANAVLNVARYGWAQDRVAQLRRRVRPYMEMGEQELWALLPSQGMGRDASVYRHGRGCPQCMVDRGAERVGPGSWRVDLLSRPWQVQCRDCDSWFPKNDFASYYESALDEHHNFHAGEGGPPLAERKSQFTAKIEAFRCRGEDMVYAHFAKIMTSFQPGLFAGADMTKHPRDNLDLERWFRFPKSHQRRVHGHRHG